MANIPELIKRLDLPAELNGILCKRCINKRLSQQFDRDTPVWTLLNIGREESSRMLRKVSAVLLRRALPRLYATSTLFDRWDIEEQATRPKCIVVLGQM